MVLLLFLFTFLLHRTRIATTAVAKTMTTTRRTVIATMTLVGLLELDFISPVVVALPSENTVVIPSEVVATSVVVIAVLLHATSFTDSRKQYNNVHSKSSNPTGH